MILIPASFGFLDMPRFISLFADLNLKNKFCLSLKESVYI